MEPTSKYKIDLNSIKRRAKQHSIGKECYFSSEFQISFETDTQMQLSDIQIHADS